MGIFTRSKFYYGHNVTDQNFRLDFDELDGVGTKTAELQIGSYTFTDFAKEISRALNQFGNLDYVTTLNRETRKITISANQNFSLLPATGPTLGTSIFPLVGFVTDQTGASSYTSENASGSEFKPQVKLQNFISFNDDEEATQSTINQSGDGRNVQVVSFGKVNFMTCNIRFQTDRGFNRAGPIEADPNGVGNLRKFMQYIRKKRPVEFMKDRDTPNSFDECLLESTPQSGEGTAFRLREMREGLGYFETGNLRFRKI